jgi:hypothetical protein
MFLVGAIQKICAKQLSFQSEIYVHQINLSSRNKTLQINTTVAYFTVLKSNICISQSGVRITTRQLDKCE